MTFENLWWEVSYYLGMMGYDVKDIRLYIPVRVVKLALECVCRRTPREYKKEFEGEWE